MVTKRQRSSWDSRATTRGTRKANSRYLLGRRWPGESGEKVAGNEDLAGRYTGESLEMSKDEGNCGVVEKRKRAGR